MLITLTGFCYEIYLKYWRVEDDKNEVVPTSPKEEEEERKDDKNEEVVPTSPKEEEEERKDDKNEEVLPTSPKEEEEGERKHDEPSKKRKRKTRRTSSKKN
ncbi:hypothetical protein CEXT_544411 [Caerostris extrusa]|uniref:Uncharacterized protein n=1 Tax=Caerostris extrusa TaxID=172846 RepID=A0AAV4U6G5_CAEEX|nr:hypothetical protein CEXT_544411 [Caerostris extrusa]